jgi:hypothetical protein
MSFEFNEVAAHFIRSSLLSLFPSQEVTKGARWQGPQQWTRSNESVSNEAYAASLPPISIAHSLSFSMACVDKSSQTSQFQLSSHIHSPAATPRGSS